MVRQSYLAAIERNVECTPGFASEPYETAWATEAIFYLRVLDSNSRAELRFVAEISPDGMRWVPHGAHCSLLPIEDLVALKLVHFGSWLRLRRVDDSESAPRILLYLDLK